jgi:3-hydroxyacyl-CoA dehydrogenase
VSRLLVRKAAVLGAGVMGAQIAAHLANAGVQPILFELAADGKDKNAGVKKAIGGLTKLNPPPLATAAVLAKIQPANYDENLPWLAECDLVIEAISERMDWKKALYEKVAPHVAPNAIFASNTSGLSVTELSKVMPEALRPRFCGIHFFNPPRYMRLVEVIPTAATDAKILDDLETFLTTTLGKGVIRARDTPNFIANRVGGFSMLATMHHTAAFRLGFDEVDALTGPAIGRGKSATYRTADMVGLDTLAHVTRTLTDSLPDDPWHAYYGTPEWMQALIAKGALGNKAGGGIYLRKGKDILVLDPATQDYRPQAAAIADEVQAILKIRDPAGQFAMLRTSSHPQAQFLWAMFRDVFHYCAVLLGDIAHNARDLDLAMRWGYGWKTGPFETWQAAGWQQVAGWIAEDIAAGKALAKVPLPAWVTDGRTGVHAPEGSYSAASGKMVARSSLPVYARQLFPETVLGEKPAVRGITVFEDEGVRMWHQDDRIAIVSFKSKMHALGLEVLQGLNKALDIAERDFDALVIWHEAPFAVGANLKAALEALKAGEFESFEAMIARFQQT